MTCKENFKEQTKESLQTNQKKLMENEEGGSGSGMTQEN